MIINPISLGGNGLLPEIIVTAPSGSTLDLMQGSVVLQTYALSSTETQHTFTVKNTGTYTVRGTRGSNTASVEVVADATGQFSCTIQYFNGLKLYWYGDECEDVTGGWNTQGKYSDYTYSASGTVTKNSDHIEIAVQSRVWAVCTDNMVNLSGYSSLHYIFENTATGDGNTSISLSETKLKEVGEIGHAAFIGSSAIEELVLNFNSSLSAYVTVGGYISTVKIYAVWIE